MTPERVEVVIIGAGIAGLVAAINLRNSGHLSILVIERSATVGGTWRDNTYPGVACDVPSHLYALADHPNPSWSSVFADGGEILQYLSELVDQEGLDAYLRLNTRMVGAEWLEDDRVWRIETNGSPVEAEVVILACGRLTEPIVPDLPGTASFPGPVFHSARWDHDAQLAGARVAVVGTGASAVQIVPELAKVAEQTVVFQRTPAWIVPRNNKPYSDKQRQYFAGHPEALQRLRSELLGEGEARFASRSGDIEAAERARDAALTHLASQVHDPELRASLTPAYAFGCKRVLLSDDFYPALSMDAVTLEASGLQAINGKWLRAQSGAEYEADVIVFATGFESAAQPFATLVRGERGITLDEHWSTGMRSFASTIVDGFPNLFVLNGPNASLGHNSAILMMEEQTQYILRALALRRRLFDPVLRVKPARVAQYSAEIDNAAAGTPWVIGECRNWYVDPRSNRLTLLWPGTVAAFRSRLLAADGSEFVETPLAQEMCGAEQGVNW